VPPHPRRSALFLRVDLEGETGRTAGHRRKISIERPAGQATALDRGSALAKTGARWKRDLVSRYALPARWLSLKMRFVNSAIETSWGKAGVDSPRLLGAAQQKARSGRAFLIASVGDGIGARL
jgi:hypothetical protein